MKSPFDRLASTKYASIVSLSAITSAITFVLMILLEDGCCPGDTWLRGWLGGVYTVGFLFIFIRSEK